MGQAKKRGTFEQRQAEAIQREVERVERRKQELAAELERQRQFDLAHPKQAQARRARSRRTGVLLATLAGLSLGALSFSAHSSGDIEAKAKGA